MVERKEESRSANKEIKQSQSHGNFQQQEEVKGESGGTASPQNILGVGVGIPAANSERAKGIGVT